MSNGSISGADRASGNQMAAYDKLPVSARLALQGAQFDWAATAILARHRRAAKGYRTGADIARSVRWWDSDQHAKDVKRAKDNEPVGIMPRNWRKPT